MGVKATVEYNMAALYPDVAAEWHDTLNGHLRPEQFTPYSNKNVWWRCERGHEWKTSIAARTHQGSGCKICNCAWQTSFQEQAIYFYIKSIFEHAQNRYRVKFENESFEIDVYIPELNLGIEYDGEWHRDKLDRDLRKSEILIQNGIDIIRVRQHDLPKISMDSLFVLHHYQFDHDKSLNRCIRRILTYIANKTGRDIFVRVNVSRDKTEILNQFRISAKNNSFGKAYPELLKQWNYKRNGDISPYAFSPMSNTEVWWICENNHEWSTAISNRATGKGCPYCSNRLVNESNCLSTINPDLCSEWDYDKNEITPEQVTPTSHCVVWWKCDKYHTWTMEVRKRTQGRGCPYCNNVRACIDNCLATINPELAYEWDHEKNGELTPYDVLPTSTMRAFWKCSRGHSWDAVIDSRNRGAGCRYCAGQAATPENNLTITNPIAAAQWHPYKNGDLKPTDVMETSRIKIWWLCECGNEWEARVVNRRNSKHCRKCASKRRFE